jgi:GMP synthase (glutamine-hydrolysing)
LGKLLIIKTGSTFGSILKIYGDFQDFIINGAGITSKKVIVCDVYNNVKLPELEDIDKIIITGSHSMVTDYKEWSVYTAKWLEKALYTDVSVLGICYGHQLLAQVFGGEVDYHPNGQENGSVEIELTQLGISDPLIGVLPHRFVGFSSHAQTIIKLPSDTLVLAKNQFEPYHGVLFKRNIWGVQYHPEFNAGIMRMYIEEEYEDLKKQGYDVDNILSGIKENPFGKVLLRRFIEL